VRGHLASALPKIRVSFRIEPCSLQSFDCSHKGHKRHTQHTTSGQHIKERSVAHASCRHLELRTMVHVAGRYAHGTAACTACQRISDGSSAVEAYSSTSVACGFGSAWALGITSRWLFPRPAPCPGQTGQSERGAGQPGREDALQKRDREAEGGRERMGGEGERESRGAAEKPCDQPIKWWLLVTRLP